MQANNKDIGIGSTYLAYSPDGVPSVNWGQVVYFTYRTNKKATGVDISIHFTAENVYINASMSKANEANNDSIFWAYNTTFYPHHGATTVTYKVHYPNNTTTDKTDMYVDPAGYVYDAQTGYPPGRGDGLAAVAGR